MAHNENGQLHVPMEMYRVVGIRPDGVRELCAAAVNKEIADTVAGLERKIRNYADVLIEPDGLDNGGKLSREWK
jgi:hypothetical protein